MADNKQVSEVAEVKDRTNSMSDVGFNFLSAVGNYLCCGVRHEDGRN